MPDNAKPVDRRVRNPWRWVVAVLLAGFGLLAAVLVPATNTQFVDKTITGGSAASGKWPSQSGLLWWLDAGSPHTQFQAADCTNPVTSSTQSVLCWKDRRVGYGNSLTSAGTTGPQREGAKINGILALQFEAGELLSGPNLFSATSVSNMHVIVVARENTRSANMLISLNGSDLGNTNRVTFHLPWSNGQIYFDAGGCCTNSRAVISSPKVTTGSPFVVNGSKSGNQVFLQLNNGTVYSNSPYSSPAAVVSGGLAVGDNNGGLANHTIAEILVYDHMLAPTELSQVRNYLLSRWGV